MKIDVIHPLPRTAADPALLLLLRNKVLPCALLSLASTCLLAPAAAQGVRLKASKTIATELNSSKQVVTPADIKSTGVANTSTSSSTGADYIVAIVNSEPVTAFELRDRIARVDKRLTAQNVAKPPRSELEREVMEDLIQEKIQLQLARQSGIKIEAKAIDAALQNIAAQNKLFMDELKARSKADGVDFEQLRTDIQNQLTLQKLRDREVPSKLTIPESEIEAYLREQVGVPTSGGLSIDLSQILVIVPEDANPTQVQAARQRADRLLARAKAGEDFFKLVQENSDAKDARTGGQMGLRSIERYPTLFVEATQNLNVNDISGVIRSGAGFHILKVLDKQQADSGGGISIPQTRVRHILLRTSAQLSESAAKAKLSDIKKRIESGKADFATLAKENSQDGSAAEGGLLGWANLGQFVPEFETAMNALAVDKISEPITSRFGVHLIWVEARRQNQLSKDDQRELARNILREKKQDENYTKWLKELRSNAYVEFREPPQ